MLKQPSQYATGHFVPPVIHRMSDTLLLTFRLDPKVEHAIQNQHQASSLEEGVQLWLSHLFIFPDEYMGELLMPLITTKFAEYIEHLRRAE